MSDFDSSLPVRTQNDGDIVVRVGDGVVPSQKMTVNPDGSINVSGAVDANVDLAETNSKLDNITSELAQVNIVLGEVATDAEQIKVYSESIDIKLDTTNDELANISTALTQPLQIQSPVIAAGTVDGSSNGTPVVFVNNIKNQILAAADRDQEIIYEDFGTKDQRIVEINYTSPTFPGTVARKQLTYVLESGRYKRTNITWLIVP